MAWKQIATPYLKDDLVVDNLTDWAGWCLAVAEVAGGTPRKYASAWDAWVNNRYKHTDRNLPDGLWVPVFWDGYWRGGRYGHVAWAKRSGSQIQIVSSPMYSKPYFDRFSGDLNSIIDYVTRAYGMTSFVGWGEELATKRFVQNVQQVLEPYQRQVGETPVFYRTAPKTSAAYVNPKDPSFDPGAVLDFKGYVKGEMVKGPDGVSSDIWFVGLYTGGYAWSRGFTDPSTKGLTNLTVVQPDPPSTNLEPNQRQVGDTPVFNRLGPDTNYSPVDTKNSTLPAGTIITCAGYVKGMDINGTDIWYVDSKTGGYSNAGGYTSQSVTGLKELTFEAPEPPEKKESLKFIDVSAWQGETIDWAKVKSAGCVGVILKSGHTGPSYNGVQPYNLDPYHDRWAKEARVADLRVGHYWYCYQSLDPVAEAKAFVASDILSGEPLFIDAEEIDLTQEWVEKFAKTIFDEVGATAIYYDYTSNLINKTWVTGDVWQGEYDVGEGNYKPVRDLNVIMHQYSSTEQVAGVQGRVDVNAFYGSIEDWTHYGLWENDEPTYPDPEEPEKPDTEETNNLLKAILDVLTSILNFFKGIFKSKD